MPPLVKIIVIATFVLILISLGTALYRFATSRGGEEEDNLATVKALSVRVGLSIALFVFLMVLSALGIITPNA